MVKAGAAVPLWCAERLCLSGGIADLVRLRLASPKGGIASKFGLRLTERPSLSARQAAQPQRNPTVINRDFSLRVTL